MDLESRQKMAGGIMGLGVITAMVANNFMPELNVLPWAAWVAIAALLGAVGAGVGAEKGTWLAAGLGAVGGALGVVGTGLYVDLRSSISHTFWTAEFAIPVFIIAFPLAAIHKRLTR